EAGGRAEHGDEEAHTFDEHRESDRPPDQRVDLAGQVCPIRVGWGLFRGPVLVRLRELSLRECREPADVECDLRHTGGPRAGPGSLPRTKDRREMAARTPVLDKTDLFGTLPPELLEQLRGRTALKRYRRGDAIFEK